MVAMKNSLQQSLREPLSGPFATTPSPDGVRPSRAVNDLVRSQVQALLASSPAFHDLDQQHRHEIEQNLTKIAAYSAALIQDDWAQSKKLGQTPVLLQETVMRPLAEAARRTPGAALARAADQTPTPAEEFSPRAANQVARITQQTLNAIAFPTFVADLIKGTFQAIVNASIQQMEAYGNLLANVAKTVDQFMSDNITDNTARDYLASSYPGHFKIETSNNSARVRMRDGADDLAKPNFRTDLGLNEDVSLDDDTAEEMLVPAARRKIAQNRHQMLSTMVLMGINRIVVTSGRIRAKLDFQIDARDTGRAETASQFDWKNEATMGFGGGLVGWLGGASGEVKNTVTYVSSKKNESTDDLQVRADLMGEVDIKFKSDYFPLERFANPNVITLIQGNTANPTANAPATPSGGQQAPERAA
jgi:hypothetical protein